jgi:hypothetical protein
MGLGELVPPYTSSSRYYTLEPAAWGHLFLGTSNIFMVR